MKWKEKSLLIEYYLCTQQNFMKQNSFWMCKLLIKIKYCKHNFDRKTHLQGKLFCFLAASLEPLAPCRNVSSLSLFYRYYFGRCSSELAQLVPLPFLEGGLLVILIDCMIFLSLFLDVTRMYVNSFIHHTAKLSAYRMLSFDLWSEWF